MPNKKIKIKDATIDYNFKRIKTSKNIRLRIYPDGSLCVTAPKYCPRFLVNDFLKEKGDWIYDKLKTRNLLDGEKKKEEKEKFQKNKIRARKIIEDKIGKLNKEYYNFSYNKIFIRNPKTRWGSCSRDKNLNFSYKLIFLPEDASDYIIIHELCHLQEMNHGPKFWNLVARGCPDYKFMRKSLKYYANIS